MNIRKGDIVQSTTYPHFQGVVLRCRFWKWLGVHGVEVKYCGSVCVWRINGLVRPRVIRRGRYAHQ
jgi:hypothetical protein